jgi:hypothetical protein
VAIFSTLLFVISAGIEPEINNKLIIVLNQLKTTYDFG